jgi:hypothetical protein
LASPSRPPLPPSQAAPAPIPASPHRHWPAIGAGLPIRDREEEEGGWSRRKRRGSGGRRKKKKKGRKRKKKGGAVDPHIASVVPAVALVLSPARW